MIKSKECKHKYSCMLVCVHICTGTTVTNLTSFHFSASFLKEVSDSSGVNQMDASNLGIVFSPTVFRSDQSDIMKVLAEAKTAQVCGHHQKCMYYRYL